MSGLYKFFPTPSDKMGILWALSSIEDACVIEYGPGGTTHYSMEGIFKINAEIESNIYTTHIDQDDIVMGNTEKLHKAILEIDKVHQPKYIFVIVSSLVSIIGTDVEGVAFEIQDEINAKLIIYTSGGFGGDYTVGIEKVYTDLAEHIIQEPKEKKVNTYNIIGCSVDHYQFASDMNAIKQVLYDALGMTCGCVFTSGTDLNKIEKASEASINIVLRQEGIPCAKIMQSKFDVDYVYAMPIGYEATFAMIHDIATKVGITPNQTYINQKRKEMAQHLMKAKSLLSRNENKNVVISGNYDVIKGYEGFLEEELRLSVKKVLVNHQKQGDIETPEHYLFSAKEKDKKGALANIQPGFVFADGVMVHFIEHNCFKMQVQNPNIDEIIISTHKPFMCFDGANDIIERLIRYLFI